MALQRQQESSVMSSEGDREHAQARASHSGSAGLPRQADIRVISLEKNILEQNEQYAQQNRALLCSKGIYTLNLMSSPGSGKTTLLIETLQCLKGELRCAVIEGDQQTSNDALRIAATQVPVVQINTRQSCHLDAYHVQRALEALPLDGVQLLFIENVGNLICPANFYLGEDEKVALMSVTEGEDKPLKYPLVFHLADLLVLTKLDLLPYLRFDLQLCRQNARQVHPGLRILETSAYTQDGMSEWLDYLRAQVHAH
jgi:hydrogenase nickel incorporation protein HypB